MLWTQWTPSRSRPISNRWSPTRSIACPISSNGCSPGSPVVVSELGAERSAYGEYFGDGVAREAFEDRIVIYRDTLERDFGHDRDLLARQVERTLRHELAHHLGWDERGVGGLGL